MQFLDRRYDVVVCFPHVSKTTFPLYIVATSHRLRLRRLVTSRVPRPLPLPPGPPVRLDQDASTPSPSPACGSLAGTKLEAEVKVVDGAAEASLGDAEHGVLMRSTRGVVEVVSPDYVDGMAGTAAGRAVAALLAAAMEFAF